MVSPAAIFSRSAFDSAASFHTSGRAFLRGKNLRLNICRRQLLTNLFGLHQIQSPAWYSLTRFFPSGTIFSASVRQADLAQATQAAHYRRMRGILLLPLFRVRPGITTRENNSSVSLCFIPRGCFFTFGASFFFTPEYVKHLFYFLNIGACFSLLVGLLRGAACTREKSRRTDKQASRNHIRSLHDGR